MNARDLAARVSNGGLVKRDGDGWMVCCPAHNDKTPSLRIGPGEKQDVVLHCHAGCSSEQVLDAINMTWEDVSDHPTQPDEERAYDYRDAYGQLVYQVVRRPPKKFLQRQPGPDGQWVWNLKGIERVLYRLPQVLTAVADGKPVWIVEGEKDADYVTAQGVCGTTNAGGAGKWSDSYSEALEGADVTVWADRDEPGWKHARAIRESLLEHGVASVRIVESRKGKDAADHLSSGLTLDDVLVTVPAEEPDVPTLFMRADEFLAQERDTAPWAIPGLMRKGERMILTGYEGFGKSAMLKQIAVCTAVGMQPFSLTPNGQPKRVVVIDCENPTDDLMEDFDRLRNAAKREGLWDDPDLFIEPHAPINLGDLPDVAWLAERVRAHEPDLLVIGPLYNMMSGDSAKEVEVARLLHRLAQMQAQVPFALVIEHHPPHAVGNEERSVRPIGSTILQRWPSFGFGLMPTDKADMSQPFEFRSWRGARRRGRSWPAMIRQLSTGGDGWYWVEDVSD